LGGGGGICVTVRGAVLTLSPVSTSVPALGV
jgi:hypothetical protein